MRSLVRVCPLVLALALPAVPASADVYFVTLTNGTVVETARQPEQASWDSNMVLLLTEAGNWVGFTRDEIDNIRAEDPTQGFGVRISDNAIALGISPNDLPEPGTRSPQDEINERFYQLTERMLAIQERQQQYSVDQGVSTDQTQGIPVSLGLGGFSGNDAFGGLGGLGGLGGGLPSSTPTPTPGPVIGPNVNPDGAQQ